MGQHILLCCNTAWGMFNFRHGLIEALLSKGNRVTVVAPNDDASEKLKDMGCDVVDLEMSAKGLNPIEDLRLLFSLMRLYRMRKPDFIFHYTIKPNIYGSMAARFAGMPSIAVTTGLGYTFQNAGAVGKISRLLYRIALRSPRQVWFLNQDDLDAFINAGLVESENTYLLDSEGVNTRYFKPVENSNTDDKTRFLLIARMLWDKGVGEFVQSAREIRAKYPNAVFQLLGAADASNPSAISLKEIGEWENEGLVEYLGTTGDVRPVIGNADCVVLPSYYREGVPRTILEAAAMEKPVITTNSVGCKETVIRDQTGWLCEPRSVKSLSEQCEAFLALSREARGKAGAAARIYMKERFEEKLIVEKYFDAISKFS